MKKLESKDDILKRAYRRLLTLIAVSIAFVVAVILFCRPFLPTLSAQFVVMVLIPTGIIGSLAIWQRKRLERDGISGDEWKSFIWKQPIMKVIAWGMLIVLIARVFKVLK
jgi:hypothetical protein